MIKRQPKNMTICQLEVLLMPNGELICLGKTIGWFSELKKCLSTYKEENGTKTVG